MSLEPIKQCCQSLTSEKVTERKNASDKLRSLLNNLTIISGLNSRSGNSFSWSQVFRSAGKYFILEARKLEDEERTKSSVSGTVLRNRENHKRLIASLPLLVLKKACRGTPHVSAQLIIDFTLKVLNRQNPYLLENFAGEVLQIIQKFVLHFRLYFSEMTMDNWRNLLKICVWIYEKNIANVDPQTTVGIMAGIVRRCQSCEAPQGTPIRLGVLHILPEFLRRSLLSDNLSKQFGVHTSFLKLLLAFYSATACEWRGLLCRLGEDTFDSVLSMWDERPSLKQALWLEYVCLLVTLHHPQKEDECHLADGTTRWHRCLRHLYRLLHDHLALPKTWSEGVGEGVLPRGLLRVVVRVCLQVFSGTEATGFIDITQLPSTSAASAPSAKRRKIEVGLAPLADRLRLEGTQPHLLPWYEVLTTLLRQHSQFFTAPRCELLLGALKEVLAKGCTDLKVLDMVLRCLSALATQYSAIGCQTEKDRHSGTNPWAPVWDMTLRLVSGRQSSGPSLILMGTLIDKKLIIPESSAYKLFHQNHLDCNEAALWALLAALTSVPLPTHLDSEPAWLNRTHLQDARNTLIEYCLPAQRPGTVGGGGSVAAFGCLTNPALLAKVLECLCYREPHITKVNLNKLRKKHQSHDPDLITELEATLHLMTFTCDLPAAKVKLTDDLEEEGGGGGGAEKVECVLAEKWAFVIERVCTFTEQVATKETQASTEGVEALIHLAELHTLLYASTQDGRLKDKYIQVMSLVASAFEKMAHRDVIPWSDLHRLITGLLRLFGGAAEDDGGDEEVEEGAAPPPRPQLLSSTPPSLYAVMLSLLEKHCERASENGTQLVRENSLNQATFDDFDLVDDTVPSSSEAVRDEILEFEDEATNQNREETLRSDEHITVDNLRTLSQRDRCEVLAGQWLVAASGSGAPGQVYLDKAVDVVLRLSSRPAVELADVALVLPFVRSLFSANYSEDNILDGLEAISSVAKVYGVQTHVARSSLNTLAELVRRHGPQLSRDVRASLLTLVMAFVKKHCLGAYDSSVAKAVLLVNVELTKVDPLREWSKYEIPNYEKCWKIHSVLLTPNTTLRLAAAAATHLLLLAPSKRANAPKRTNAASAFGQLSAPHQDQVFEEVYQTVLEAMNVAGLPNEGLAPDERGNRVASFLMALGTVALCSPFLEGKALFALCLSVPGCGVETSRILQLLTCVTKAKGTTPHSLLSANLPYLAAQWVQHRHDITAFPSAAFGQNAHTFLSENRHTLLPVLLECEQQAGVEALAEACGESVKDLFIDVFPLLMARIFPYIAAEQGKGAAGCQLSEAKIQAGKRQYKHLERTLGTEAFTTLLSTHIGQVTLHLLRLVHEPQPWVEGEVVVPPPPPSFTPDVVHATLGFVGTIFRQDGVLLLVLSSRRRQLHLVVGGVVGCLATATTPHTARAALSTAGVLLEAILPHLATRLVRAANYLLRLLVHTLTHSLARLWTLGHHLAARCTHLLHRLLDTVLQHLPGHLAPSVPTLFGRLLPLATRPGVAPLLQLLLDSNHPGVQEAVAHLPALPQHPDGSPLATLHQAHQRLVAACRGRPGLLEEVDNFLSVAEGAVATHHLTHLTATLRAARGQVADLYSGTGPGQESRGHRLTHRLVALAGVATEACQCLGVLGPLSLATPVFLTGGQPQEEGGQVKAILLALDACLTCGQVEVEQAAGQALLGVLATFEGHEAYQDLPSPTAEELWPLLPEGRPKARATGGLDMETYGQIVGDEALWVGGAGYEAWVCSLAAALVTAGCGSDVAPPLQQLCALRPDLSARVLPFLVHTALTTDTSGGRRDVLSRMANTFFGHHGQEGGTAACQDKAAIQAMLAVVDHLRLFSPPPPLGQARSGGGQGQRRGGRGVLASSSNTPFDRHLWLRVNYLQVAAAAHQCGAHFSALLCLQLHHHQMLQHTPPECGAAAITRRLQAPPMARVAAHPEAPAAGRLLLAVHEALGDGAGVEGCLAAGAAAADGPAARLMRCRHGGEWLAGLAVCDAAGHSAGLLEGLEALGLYSTMSGVLAGTQDNTHTQAQCHAAWRLCHWEGVNTGGGGGAFHQHLCEALCAMQHKDTLALHRHTHQARNTLTNTLTTMRLESTTQVYPLLTQLQILTEVEEVAGCLCDLTNQDKLTRDIADLRDLWAAKDSMGSVGYSYKEEVLAARVSVLKTFASVCASEEVVALLHHTLLAKSKLGRTVAMEGARGVHGLVGSEAALLWAAQLAVPTNLANLTKLEEAEVARAGGDVQRARHVLEVLLGQVKGQRGQERLQSQVLTLLGEVLMGARSLPPHTIIQDYFTPATTLLSQAKDKASQEIIEQSHQSLAQYVDQLYRQARNTLDSDASQAKRLNIKRSEEELEKLNNLLASYKDQSPEWKEIMKKMVLLQRNIKIDCEFLRELEKEKIEYLRIAVEAYLRALGTSSEHHLNTYRLAALWLNNADHPSVNRAISELGARVKSHHFVPLLYQLVARLSTHNAEEAESFAAVLLELLARVCEDHPHHGLPVVYALAHAHADHQLETAGRKAKLALAVAEEDRVQAAKLLVDRLKKGPIRNHVEEFGRVCFAYLSLATWCTSLGRMNPGDKINIPSSEPLRSLRQLRYTSTLSQPITLQPSAQYNPPLILDWETSGMGVGGINAPIRLTVRTSDGSKHLELLKGKDDVRQDAVMQQVFGVVNELLLKSAETRSIGLSVRTYQVVPLSQRSGIIQWCRNTQAFGRYVIGADKKSGAHKTYHPEDYSARVCQEKMKEVKTKTQDERLKVFIDILEHFHPVFHHFFLEQYPSPHQWFLRRLAYTGSVATNSMVGYVLGLGDRHTENILLDKTTAELIHIDLGIAFELGKVLPTPETVPFRMTQDIVAGLGVLGVEGPLRCWCEATMRVLRGGAEVLLTLVEVLRHDPLHHWTLTPQQVAKLQKGDDEQGIAGSQSTVSMAERVVLTVRQKLVGMEEGFPCSVPAQVNRLLQDATDPANLCKLFPGWQPYV